jgi:hypothetical protein
LPPRKCHDLYGSVLEFAEVRSFAAGGGDVAGLLCWLRPDALIVDSAACAEAATVFAREHDLMTATVASARSRSSIVGEGRQLSGGVVGWCG